MSEWLWLFAAAFAPYFFNVASAQHFEADKAVGVRVLAIGALTVEVLRALRRGSSPGDVRALAREVVRGTPQRVLAGGLALLVVSTVISTAISVEPRLSVWGSYERRQGALTFLSYVTLFVIAVVRLDPARVRRLVTVICQTAVAVSIYALAQASHHDPITWVLKAAGRPSSTFGNANAVAGYLAVTLALVVMRLSRAWHAQSTQATPTRVGAPRTIIARARPRSSARRSAWSASTSGGAMARSTPSSCRPRWADLTRSERSSGQRDPSRSVARDDNGARGDEQDSFYRAVDEHTADAANAGLCEAEQGLIDARGGLPVHGKQRLQGLVGPLERPWGHVTGHFTP